MNPSLITDLKKFGFIGMRRDIVNLADVPALCAESEAIRSESM